MARIEPKGFIGFTVCVIWMVLFWIAVPIYIVVDSIIEWIRKIKRGCKNGHG